VTKWDNPVQTKTIKTIDFVSLELQQFRVFLQLRLVAHQAAVAPGDKLATM